MKGINIFETIRYVSKYETNKEKPTVWLLGAIDRVTMSTIEDLSTEYEASVGKGTTTAKSMVQFSRKKLDLIRCGLKGFENFEHPQTGKNIDFDTTASLRFGKSRNIVSDRVLELIPVIDELAEEIEKLSKLSDDEQKN